MKLVSNLFSRAIKKVSISILLRSALVFDDFGQRSFKVNMNIILISFGNYKPWSAVFRINA